MENGILIVCYSYSGNTYRVASEIKRQTEGTLCEIYPKQPYSMGYETILEQVRKEIETGFHAAGFLAVWAGSVRKDCAAILEPLRWRLGESGSGYPKALS